MGLRINTNIMAIQAQRHLAEATRRFQKSMERLSSGLRINRAGDDPAGLAISERLKAQIRTLDVANRNAADGISLVQVAEGALDSVSDLLIRMKELSIQSRNGTMSDDQRTYLDAEFQSLMEEVTRIGNATEFNGNSLLDGSLGSLAIQIGLSASDYVNIDLGIDSTAGGLGIDGADILSEGGAGGAADLLDAAMDRIAGHRARLGATQNRFESIIRMNANLGENLSAANSRIRDVDVAKEMAEYTMAQILQQAGVAVLIQANTQPSLMLRLLDASFGYGTRR